MQFFANPFQHTGKYALLKLIVAIISASHGLTFANAQTLPPIAPTIPVTDNYFGHVVVDPYRWMEDPNSTQLKSWLKGESDYSRKALYNIAGRAELYKEIRALDTVGTSVDDVQVGGPYFFYQKTPPTSNTSKLYVRLGLTGKERVLVDPELLRSGSTHYSLDYFSPSRDGKYVAYAISPGGSEDSVLFVIETKTGHRLSEKIAGTQFGNVSWCADSASFFYNRLQRLAPGADPVYKYKDSTAYLHKLGQTYTDDIAVLDRKLCPQLGIGEDDTPSIITLPHCPYFFGLISHGVQNEITLFYTPMASYRGATTKWRKLADVTDDITSFDTHGSTIYVLSHKGASRYKVIATDLAHPDLAHPSIIVPPSRSVIVGMGVAKDAVYVQDLDGGIGRIRRVSFDGKRQREITLPYDGTVEGIVTDENRPGVLFMETAWTKSALWYGYDPALGDVRDTKLKKLSPISFANITSEEVKARSKDGTLGPLSIIYRRGLIKDGSHPTLMEGYGAYGITMNSYFDPTSLPWLDRGGVLAVAHVRGGGEYGEDWHIAGQKLTKQHSVDDFLACAQYLIDHKFTSPRHLAGRGASAGGITVGMALTERPDMFGAILDEVGSSDALRAELSPNGPPNIPEFGTFKDPDGFKALYAMDAYLHVKDGVKYPAVLLTTGINDPRVSYWEPAKMTARLQAADPAQTILLRVDYDAGHGIGSTKSQSDAELADEYAFLLWKLTPP
jgi:prolyl oligopeptidase